MTGSQWIGRLKAAGHNFSDCAKQLLLSPDFVPTSGVTTKIVVLPGSLWTDSDRLTSNVRTAATDRTLVKPNAEVACLVRMMFTNEEINTMGLRWLVIMHEPIKDAGGDSHLLTVSADDSDWLYAYCVDWAYLWYRQNGFVFAVPQV